MSRNNWSKLKSSLKKKLYPFIKGKKNRSDDDNEEGDDDGAEIRNKEVIFQ